MNLVIMANCGTRTPVFIPRSRGLESMYVSTNIIEEVKGERLMGHGSHCKHSQANPTKVNLVLLQMV